MVDRIEPIGSREPEIQPVLRVERREQDEREHPEREQQQRKRRAPVDEQPAVADEDGHIDVVA
jgi:hypothetical protein